MVGSVLAGYYESELTASPDTDDLLIGRVDGKLADRLNLTGGMTVDQFNDLIDGKAVDPVTGEKLRKRINREGNNRVGLDLTFDPGGKALSTFFAGTRDPLVLRLFNEARHETMVRDVEPRMMVRVRQNGANYSRITGNALWTSFPDLVTRPTKVLDAATGNWVETFTVDPHIHDHNYIFQYTFDPKYLNRDGSKGAYLSADVSKIWASMPYIQQAFHARLFKKLKDHGFNVVQTEHGLDLAGWDDEMSTMFSRRKEEIDAWADKHGIERLEAKDKLGKTTRSNKSVSRLTMDQQFDEWRDRLPEEKWEAFIKAARGGSDPQNSLVPVTNDQAIDYALAHVLERNNSATIEEILTAALDVGMGLDVDELQKRLLERKDVVSAWFGNDLIVSTQEMVALEQAAIDRTVQAMGSCLPLGRADFEFKPFDAGGGKMVELNENQRINLEKLVRSTNRFMTLRGAPGVGKTAALGTQLFRAVEENGGNIVALGSTSNARDQLIRFGAQSGSEALAGANTLAKFLGDEQMQSGLDSHTLVMLDEATLAGLKDIDQLMQIVDEQGARLLLVGDYRQMDAVQRHGKAFEQLSKIGDQAEFTEIVRQRDPEYRRAATLTSSGDENDIQVGFDKLVELGFVKEIADGEDRIERAAKAYLDIAGEKKNSRRGKQLKWSDAEKQDAMMYRSGMSVVIGKGKKAQKLEVVGRDHGKVMVMPAGGEPEDAKPLDMTEPKNLKVYEANYRDAILITGTHRIGEAVSKVIRDARRQAGELGHERGFDRLESLGFSNEERKRAERYEPGRQIVEFSRKATTRRLNDNQDRSITYGEQFVISGRDEHGNVAMTSRSGEELQLPIELSDRFDVYRLKSDRIAAGDRIRMTKGGRMLPEGSKQGSKFSNNDVFTVKGFDDQGNLIVGNGHTLSKDFHHWRSGYYKTSMAGQGSTSSHNIFVDSKEAGKARSKEAWLVSVTRGKHAATILTDDMQGLRNHAILRSAQRHSAIEVAAQARKATPEETRQEVARIQEQSRRLEKVDEFAQLATDATVNAIRKARQQIGKQARKVIQLTNSTPPLNDPIS